MVCDFTLWKKEILKKKPFWESVFMWFEGRKTFSSKKCPHVLLRLFAAVSTITAEFNLECKGSDVSVYILVRPFIKSLLLKIIGSFNL